MLVILLGLFLAVVYSHERQMISDNLARMMREMDLDFQTMMEADTERLDVLLDVISLDRELRAAFQARDRQGLHAEVMPMFKNLKIEHHIAHLYFITPERKVLLRVHRPGRYGDLISRPSMLEAEKTGKPAHGISIGQLQTLSLRVVRPWYDGERLLGYLELDEDITRIVRRLHERHKTDFFLSVYKKFLNRNRWEAGTRERGEKGDWEQFDDSVVIASSLRVMPRGMAAIQARHHAQHLFAAEARGKSYRIGFLPLMDTGGNMVGEIAMFYDVTGLLVATHDITLGATAVVLGLGGVILLLFHGFLGRISRQMLEEHREREAIQQKYVTDMQEREQELKQALAKMRVAQEASLNMVADSSQARQEAVETATKLQKALRELEAKTDRLERFQKITVDRELDMVRLKAEVNELLERLGRPGKYEAPAKIARKGT